LVELLRRWESMGIGITSVVEDQRTHIIRAKLQSHNSVGLKSMRFRIEVVSVGGTAANAIFSQEKGIPFTISIINRLGAGSSFTRVVQQVDAVLCGKGYLVSGSQTEKAIPPLTPRLPGIEV
jgi:Fungal kinase associated-1 domain